MLSERKAVVAEAIAVLSMADREVLMMRHLEYLGYDDIASLLDISPAAARQRYARAILRLQKLCENHEV